ncbi:3-methylcrotonyl-CoA carboxylase subunit alpha [Choiromyces venosus 120613-1]|uniref:3-methylcrotonyl-CoA carboxylase subunit alpha n=1 Tax=Choiromyces venosus 120613-1 TaxID=1336337 RepID=A0A3N4K6X3_9PEZI|nr:3-methylcrotonyl-CoA carboxylase subunit alpha [Choiromyces venosus 120613-1]
MPRPQLARRALLSLTRPSLRWQSSSVPKTRPLRSILIANRGEIALRVNRTASEYGIRTTTVYTDPDAHAQHASVTPHSVNLGPPSAYLDVDKIIKAAKERGCDSIHPGYGFLSENSAFAKRVTEEGLIFIGPPSTAIEAMGNKSQSKDIMLKAGVPCIPGYHGSNQDPDFLLQEASKIGFPVLVKAVKGGGGKGMRIAKTPEEFPDMLNSAKSEARSSFGDDVVLVEKYITTPRHIEVQVFADNHGNCVALGERDCSVQRRHQKILEESPAPDLDPVLRKDIWDKARAAALAVGYQGAGTVEFIFDNDTGEFFFMEMNTRLQVEHPVTEEVTGTDLVHWQLLVAAGHPLPLTQEQVEKQMEGHAFEARIYAENPDMGFVPDSGELVYLRTPKTSATVRIDAGFGEGDVISPHYDPMIAKLIVKGPDRNAALAKLRAALEEYEVVGLSTNIEFLKKLAAHPAFIAGDVETGFIDKHRSSLFAIEPTPPEVYAQAAMSVILNGNILQTPTDPFSVWGGNIGFIGSFQERIVEFVEKKGETESHIPVSVKQTGRDTYDLTINSKITYPSITAHISPLERSKVVGFYPHTRLETTVVRKDDTLVVFQRGKQYKLDIPRPAWFEVALGVADVANSVLAPMPCKVLRVSVKEGDRVAKDAPLVVIESMKMETVIRSPHDGVISKIVHGEGVSLTIISPTVGIKVTNESTGRS